MQYCIREIASIKGKSPLQRSCNINVEGPPGFPNPYKSKGHAHTTVTCINLQYLQGGPIRSLAIWQHVSPISPISPTVTCSPTYGK
jgi:hypothetical protein